MTKRVAAEIASLATCRTSSRRSRRATPTTAMPRMREKSTTAGTTLFARELNGFAGMYRSMKLKAGRCSTRLELKNDAFWTEGNVSGIRNANASARSHRPPITAAARRPSVRSSDGLERPETGDDRDGDVGQHHHLEQLDEPVGRPLQRRRPLAEEQPGEDAESEPGEDLSRERHEAADPKTAKRRPPCARRRAREKPCSITVIFAALTHDMP